MSQDRVERFQAARERGNALILDHAGTGTKRFLNLDWRAYQDGALPARTKELLGLTASLVLRCDDCILYHVIQCHALGVSTAELEEATHVGLVVGGSIVIPHLRRLWEAWEELQAAARA
jgi:ribonuclease HI